MVNRRAEVWWALLAIAERVGGNWPERARSAAAELSSGRDDADEVPNEVRLLIDMRDVFGDQQTIFTKTLPDKLNDLDESPWGARRHGEGLDARGLSRMLRPFKIRPRTIGSGSESADRDHADERPLPGRGDRPQPLRVSLTPQRWRSRSRPPTEEEMVLLLDGCSALGDEYARMMRALVTFGAFTLMRPSELVELDWEGRRP